VSVIYDQEVLELFAREPELLAIADAVAATRPSQRRRLSRRPLALVAVAVAVLALAIVSPWQQRHASVVDRALAAIGDAPVLHAVTRQVSLASGKRVAEQRVDQTEIWYDQSRGLEHTLTRTNGVVSQDVLQTPDGVSSDRGPVYTCAWIARHPLEATKERVSCRFDGNNGTIPRNVPESPPVVDPALAGFVNGYRDALASGEAQKIGEGELDGRHVYWLELRLQPPVDPSAPAQATPDQRERVAVDAETYKPLLVRTFSNGSPGVSYSVLQIETLAAGAGDFRKPTLQPAERLVSIGSVEDPRPIDLAGARALLGDRGFWLGSEFEGLKLSSIERVTLRTGYSRLAGLPPRDDPGLRLSYGERAPGASYLTLTEAARPEFALGWSSGPFPAETVKPGFLRLAFFGGYLIRDGLYLSIVAKPSGDSVLAAARSLVPIP
jgi:hypothetical protein